MLKSINTAATGMMAQQNQMDTIANNIANANTMGFKKSRAEFEDLLYQTIKEPGSKSGLNAYSPNGVQTGLGVRTAATQKDFAMGSQIITKNPLDLMIEGNGFFQVLQPDGQVAYTRDGAFRKDANGKVVDKNGNALQPEITIPPNAIAIQVTNAGQFMYTTDLSTPPSSLGQIDVINFINPAGLKSLGKNLYASTPSSGQAITQKAGQNGTGQIAQGQLETSNVSLVDEMVNMITTQRAYETNGKVLQASDQMMQSINSLR